MAQGFPHARGFTRVQLKLTVEVCAGGGAVFSGPVRDLALGGIYVLGVCPLLPDEPCMIEIKLMGEDPGLKVQTRGRVVRVEQGGAAIEFTELSLDAFEHLQKLILYNSEQPDEIEEEFASCIGLGRRR